MKLTIEEKSLVGGWKRENDSVIADEVTLRIKWLIKNQLKKIAADKSGWDILYVNPDENQFWKFIYPQGEMQGGGPPSLIIISQDAAKLKYSI